MQQIYKRTPMLKCDFNEVALLKLFFSIFSMNYVFTKRIRSRLEFIYLIYLEIKGEVTRTYTKIDTEPSFKSFDF